MMMMTTTTTATADSLSEVPFFIQFLLFERSLTAVGRRLIREDEEDEDDRHNAHKNKKLLCGGVGGFAGTGVADHDVRA